jgi:hypothetical protein
MKSSLSFRHQFCSFAKKIAMKPTLRIFSIAALLMFVVGCESYQTEHLALNQGKTLTDMHYAMVLDNIAMARDYPGTLPWHAKFTQGTAATQDTYSPGFNMGWRHIVKTGSVTAALQTQHSWVMTPLMGANLLQALKPIYCSAAHESWIRNGIAPLNCFYGRYGAHIVWVDKKDMDRLSKLTLQVLHQETIAIKADATESAVSPPKVSKMSNEDLAKSADELYKLLRDKAGFKDDMKPDDVQKANLKYIELKDLVRSKAEAETATKTQSFQIISAPSPAPVSATPMLIMPNSR